jgi:hypothetical protein
MTTPDQGRTEATTELHLEEEPAREIYIGAVTPPADAEPEAD